MNARVPVAPSAGLLPAAALSGAWIAAWLLAARGGIALSPTVLLVAVAVCAWCWGPRAAWLATVMAALACAGSSAVLSGADQRALETAILAVAGALIGSLPRNRGSDTGDDPGDPGRASALAAIVESSDDAIVGRDLDGIVTSWNPGAEAMFGFTAADMLGGPILRLVPTELHAEEADHRRRIVQGERLRHFETVRLRKDGTRFDVSITASAIRTHTVASWVPRTSHATSPSASAPKHA